jgi:hypothetical protein
LPETTAFKKDETADKMICDTIISKISKAWVAKLPAFSPVAISKIFFERKANQMYESEIKTEIMHITTVWGMNFLKRLKIQPKIFLLPCFFIIQ